MLPPIPQGLVPVTSQHDVLKPQPPVAPVVPMTESAKDSALSLDRDEVAAAQERAREEQRRRQKRQQDADQTGELDVEDEQDSPENLEQTGISRKGLWVDIKV